MKTARAAALAFPALLAACGTSDPAPPPTPTPDLRSDKIRVTNPAVSDADAAQLGRRQPGVRGRHAPAAAGTGDRNFIFSQTSISTALAMLYAGAATTTAAEMASTLHFSPARRAPARGVQRARPGADHAARGRRRRRLPPQARELELGAGRVQRPPRVPRHAGRQLRRRPVPEGLHDPGRGRARRHQRLGVRSDRSADPGAVPAGIDQRHDAAGARQRGVLPRRLEEAVQPQQPERPLPRPRRRRLRADDDRQRQRAAVERGRLRRRVGRVRR